MPCDQRITISVDLDATDKGLLEEAINSLGFKRNGQWFFVEGVGWAGVAGGKIQASIARNDRGVEAKLEAVSGQIRQAYSRAAVKKAAAKFGWRVRQTADNKFKVSRGY